MSVQGKLVDLDVEYEIPDEVLDDYELLEILNDIDEGQMQKITKAFKMLLGDEKLNEVKAKIKAKEGHVSMKTMVNTFWQIMKQSNATKK